MSTVVQPPTLPGTPDHPVAPPPGKKQSTGIAAILEEIAAVLLMTFRAARMSVVPPFSWKGEFIEQTVLVIKRCFFPVVISTTFFGFGAPGLQGGNLVNVFGTVDRLGAFFVMASVREFAPWINGMVVAGVAGTAICADLGARKVREELDALAVLGTDLVKVLIVPRFIALGVMTVIFNYWNTAISLVGQLIANMTVWQESAAGYVSTFSSNFTIAEVVFNTLKVLTFGFIIAVVCCYKGMNAKGGAAGVGRAVNQAVVVAFCAVYVYNYLLNSLLLGAFPETSTLR